MEFWKFTPHMSGREGPICLAPAQGQRLAHTHIHIAVSRSYSCSKQGGGLRVWIDCWHKPALHVYDKGGYRFDTMATISEKIMKVWGP